ncbi:MAG: phosphate ABC transporter permease PstA [Bacteroidetes bacterium]|nr:phosphate ABC transporter permease PstA [Bacteroidota bacterium]MCW5896511.1 phosphate ABC transporter permease PstA [Bacteroidota bacterium]
MKLKRRLMGSWVVGTSAVATLTIIVVMLVMTASIVWGARDTISWEFLTAAPREGMTEGGIFPAIVGTVLLVLLMSIAGVPAGAITAIYLSEYASQKSVIARSIRFAVNTLAGVPSIVFGLFGLGFFVQFVGGGMDDIFSGGGELRWAQPNILWASLTMALLTLPVVIVSVEEAIKTVPQDLRAGSLALGATKWQTIWKVVLPNSMNGIFTGAILAVSRGAGEVAPILFTGAAYFLPHLPNTISDQFMHLGYHVYIMSTQSTNVDATKGIQYATTLVLLGLTVTLNLSAIILRSRMRGRQIQ